MRCYACFASQKWTPLSSGMRCRSHFNWILVPNLLGKSKVYWNSICNTCFASQKQRVPLQLAKHAGHISIDFYYKIYFENQNYFEHPMQVKFQLIYSQKFTGKIKSILKLAKLRKFYEPETGDLTPACKKCKLHFIWFLVQNLLGRSKAFWNWRCRLTFNWILVQNIIGKS